MKNGPSVGEFTLFYYCNYLARLNFVHENARKLRRNTPQKLFLTSGDRGRVYGNIIGKLRGYLMTWKNPKSLN